MGAFSVGPPFAEGEDMVVKKETDWRRDPKSGPNISADSQGSLKSRENVVGRRGNHHLILIEFPSGPETLYRKVVRSKS